MRISDWSSDVCSSDLGQGAGLDARNKRLLADRQKAVVAEQQRQVDALTIRATFNGQVGQAPVPQGTSLVANGPVLRVGDLDKFAVEIQVDRKSVVSGKSVQVRLDVRWRPKIKKKYRTQ